MSIDELITTVLKRKKHGDVSCESSDMQNDPLAPLKNEPNFTVVQKCGKPYKFCKRIHVYIYQMLQQNSMTSCVGWSQTKVLNCNMNGLRSIMTDRLQIMSWKYIGEMRNDNW